MEIIVDSSQETEELAKTIGRAANAGDIIILSGDLGAGKTTLTKGIALGLGITQMIKSPTYTIVREYLNGRLPLYHMDVYRVESGIEDLALDEYFEGSGLSVVEWGEMLKEELPNEYLRIQINKDSAKEEKRMILIDGIGCNGQAFLSRISESAGKNLWIKNK
ncbi:tRNA (adenosine(37)-N6)-threonylcarbamoyltransferase complex ATPase subunit type 1 TsaE [Enterococcus sp. BWB1-3]|uniref:tRNA (adenosine(37)-N6)-threonylcarbamoyltransferase complex ATPase subunit type 1 TsaE n=1 Tax=unclassified Enterococcus TaxID=2608891 RepID=UPI001921BA9D|nr:MULTISPECIES: tRNA (adenosine(37)-N6)-threonylcarbamoyltransferase complex ATPase subunit type 1 TsaE [unclassified Enterococcus]MBL1227791.1 tRNA (adenosine(37)-N6)-threonylcarbamoyltransferase complex ATPase subunit type 1 TsaE [Enterococcus sp. BWB1-3]MCB5952021.1 tRNA (adenosine(37)-N6)-threonylcarbamoyltransferase complex ATPase subunit type 1 TsaE [Enterococcus sp. BWT-B8]